MEGKKTPNGYGTSRLKWVKSFIPRLLSGHQPHRQLSREPSHISQQTLKRHEYACIQRSQGNAKDQNDPKFPVSPAVFFCVEEGVAVGRLARHSIFLF